MRAGLVALFALAPVSAFAQVNVRALSVVPDSAGIAGQPINIVASFQSDGPQVMPAFRWQVVLTTGGALDTAIPIGTLGPLSLGNGQQQSFTVSRPLPANVSGQFTVAIVADFDNAVAESNEYDNLAIASSITQVIAQAPELAITSASSGQSELRAGEPIDVAFQLQNSGELGATLVVGAYLSRDPVVTPSDLLLGTASVNVAAGGTFSGAVAGVVPDGTRVGDYVIGVIADPEGLVTERDEANNTFTATPLNVFEEALSLETETLPDGTLTVDYHLVLAAYGGDGHYAYRVGSGALPNGVTLSTDGVLEGRPTRTGRFDFQLEVRSRGLIDRRPYSVEIFSTFQPLRIVTDRLDGGFHRYPYQQVLVAGGGEAPYQWDLTPSSGTLPPGLDLSTTGVISGIPTELGHFSFGITVRDRLGATDALRFDVDVTPLATVLIANTAEPTAVVGQDFEYRFQVTGGIPPYRWRAASTPPPGLTVTEDGRLTGVPARVGQWPLRVRVIDSTSDGVSDTALFQVQVQDDGAMQVAPEVLPSVVLRAHYNVPIVVEGGDAPYTFRLGPGATLPDGFFLSEDGRIVGRAFRPMVHGFSVVVADSKGRARTMPYGLVVEGGNGSFDSGCVCVQPSGTGGLGLILLGALFFLRRRR